MNAVYHWLMKRLTGFQGPITIREVARLAGVSLATTSYALNNSGRVAPDTRVKVLKVAADLGYSPSLAARSLKGGRGKVIAILTYGMGGPWYGEILEGLQVSLNIAGYPVIACTLENDVLGLCKSMIADGIILGVVVLNPGATDSGFLRSILDSVPSILLGGDSSMLGAYSYFFIDNKGGEQALVDYLWSRGYRDFLWIDGRLEASIDARERWESFAAALLAQGGSPAAVTRLKADFRASMAYDVVAGYLATGARPRVIVAANDESALGAMSAVRQAGLSIPGDIAVAGFDGIDSSLWIDPPLTTVRFDRKALGRQMAARIVEAVENGGTSAKPETVPAVLEVRAST